MRLAGAGLSPPDPGPPAAPGRVPGAAVLRGRKQRRQGDFGVWFLYAKHGDGGAGRDPRPAGLTAGLPVHPASRRRRLDAGSVVTTSRVAGARSACLCTLLYVVSVCGDRPFGLVVATEGRAYPNGRLLTTGSTVTRSTAPPVRGTGTPQRPGRKLARASSLMSPVIKAAIRSPVAGPRLNPSMLWPVARNTRAERPTRPM